MHGNPTAQYSLYTHRDVEQAFTFVDNSGISLNHRMNVFMFPVASGWSFCCCELTPALPLLHATSRCSDLLWAVMQLEGMLPFRSEQHCN